MLTAESWRRESNQTQRPQCAWSMDVMEWVRTQTRAMRAHVIHCENGRVKCGVHISRRLQQTTVSCKRSNCNKPKKSWKSKRLMFVKRRHHHNGSPRSVMSLFTWAPLRTFFFIIMSLTKNRSIATKKSWRKNSMMCAIAGISSMGLALVVLLQIIGEDGLLWSTHRWSQNDFSPVQFFKTYWERSTNSFCIESSSWVIR